MIPITNLYEYKTLDRVTNDDGTRFYTTPEGDNVPSVTTILSATKFSKELAEWRERVGETEANRITTEATGLGSLMHTHLENYIQGIERPGGNNLVRMMARNMADVIIGRGLVNVNEIWGIESALYYPGLYAGTSDLIGVHNGDPAIMDYKTTKKPKKEEMIEDYFLQGAAYIMAHNKVHGTDIKKIVIFMVSRDQKYQEFIVGPDRIQEFTDKWLERVDKYYKMKKEG